MLRRAKLWKVYMNIFLISTIIFWTEGRTFPLPLYFRPSSGATPVQWPRFQTLVKSGPFPLPSLFTQNRAGHFIPILGTGTGDRYELASKSPVSKATATTTANKIAASKIHSTQKYPQLRLYSNSGQTHGEITINSINASKNDTQQLEPKLERNLNLEANDKEPVRISKRCFGFDCELSELSQWPTFPSFSSLSDTFSSFYPAKPLVPPPGSPWFESPSPPQSPSLGFGSSINPSSYIPRPLPPPPSFLQQNQEDFNMPPPSYTSFGNFNPGGSPPYYNGPNLLSMWNVLTNFMDLAYNVYVHTKVGVGSNVHQSPEAQIHSNPNFNDNDNDNNDYSGSSSSSSSSNYNNYDHYFDYGGNSDNNNNYDHDYDSNHPNYDYGSHTNFDSSPDFPSSSDHYESSDFGSHSSHDYDY